MLTVERVMPVAPQAVWDILVDVDKWPAWGPSVSGATLDQPGSRISAGATGRVITPVAIALPFAVTEFDELRHWAWKVAGVPATRHRVDAVDDGCRVVFEAPWWAAAYAAVCAIALRRIERMVVG